MMVRWRIRWRFFAPAVAASSVLVLSAGLAPAPAQDRPTGAPASTADDYGAALGSYERALRTLEEEAAHGDPETQWVLSAMYISGQGAPRDHARAIHWLRRAAEGGHLEAQYQLGSAYDLGLGIERDAVQALVWFEVAAARGHEGAGAARRGVSASLAPAQRSEVQRMVRAWLEAHPARAP